MVKMYNASKFCRVLFSYVIPYELLSPLLLLLGAIFLARRIYSNQKHQIQENLERPQNYSTFQSMPTPTRIFRDLPVTPSRTPIKSAPTTMLQMSNDTISVYGKFKTPCKTPQIIPNTGSPTVNVAAENRLPEWTEALRRVNVIFCFSIV